jgi:hypothetical protein
LAAVVNPDRSRTSSKNETLPRSDFFMLMVPTGEMEHELLAELTEGIQALITTREACV